MSAVSVASKALAVRRLEVCRGGTGRCLSSFFFDAESEALVIQETMGPGTWSLERMLTPYQFVSLPRDEPSFDALLVKNRRTACRVVCAKKIGLPGQRKSVEAQQEDLSFWGNCCRGSRGSSNKTVYALDSWRFFARVVDRASLFLEVLVGGVWRRGIGRSFAFGWGPWFLPRGTLDPSSHCSNCRRKSLHGGLVCCLPPRSASPSRPCVVVEDDSGGGCQKASGPGLLGRFWMSVLKGTGVETTSSRSGVSGGRSKLGTGFLNAGWQQAPHGWFW